MIDKHRDKRKYNNFGYLSTKFWLKGNDRGVQPSLTQGQKGTDAKRTWS